MNKYNSFECVSRILRKYCFIRFSFSMQSDQACTHRDISMHVHSESNSVAIFFGKYWIDNQALTSVYSVVCIYYRSLFWQPLFGLIQRREKENHSSMTLW